MLQIFKVEGKTLEEALEKCYQLTNKTKDDLYLKESSTEAKLFKSKKYIIEAIKKEDVIDFVKEYIKVLAAHMNIDIQCEIREKEEAIHVLLASSNNAILIGKEGRTLNALQILLRQSVNCYSGFYIRVNIDASNYKEKKMKNLEYEIKKIAREVKESHVDVKLDPMNSYERRLVHSLISDMENLTTESVGESPNRYVIIKYKEDL